MDAEVRTSLLNMVRGVFPAGDVLRRRRVRAGARRLVVRKAWPEDADTTGADVAQLALLRVLRLQRETRRAVRARLGDAAATSARLALEAALLGIYCLHQPDSVGKLRAANAKSAEALFKYLVEDGVVPQELVDLAVSSLGAPGGAGNLFQMSEHIDRVLPDVKAVSLYRRYYVPTSTFFVHTNAASLLRHVDKNEHLAAKPTFPWTRQSALRISDGSVGLLAAELARYSGVPAERFDAYARSHIARAYTPMAVMVVRGFRQSLRLRSVPGVVRTIRETRAYVHSDQARVDTREVRLARVRAGFEASIGKMVKLPSDVLDPALDLFSERVISAVEQQPAPESAVPVPAPAQP
ncbi:hypothetical protein ACEZCY_35645 [Streptacidiphilus sp. N1-12]|uniref:Uncharacterized protein n=1 Tax=Streptacidiphilus alkalitolerans TaxID=3342712 RepID=A0ABV6WR40_9ACTN